MLQNPTFEGTYSNGVAPLPRCTSSTADAPLDVLLVRINLRLKACRFAEGIASAVAIWSNQQENGM
jgi:hypothetical protein